MSTSLEIWKREILYVKKSTNEKKNVTQEKQNDLTQQNE